MSEPPIRAAIIPVTPFQQNCSLVWSTKTGKGTFVDPGGETFDVIHCPGHTPGHVVFFHRESALAMVGDVLFRGSIGRTDFPRGNHAALIHSITKKLWPLGDDVTFIPGHGPVSTFGQERQDNPFVADRALG